MSSSIGSSSSASSGTLTSQSWQTTIRREMKDLATSAGNIVFFEFIIGFMMIFLGVAVAGFPLGTLAVLVLFTVRILSRSNYRVPQLNSFVAIMLLALLYVTVSSLTSDYTTTSQVVRRIFRIVVVLGLVVLVADRRIDFRSLILGIATAMVINTAAFYAGIAPDNYDGYLTGWLNDKNVSGLYHAVIPLFLVMLVHKKWEKILVVLAAMPFLWLTGSRTSMAGFIMGLIWLMFASRLNLMMKAILGVFIVWFFEWLQTTFADSKVFGDRTGTDALRSMIDEASLEKLQTAPWNGLGMGQATVVLENGRSMYFHNSFWTLLVEGGWPWLVMVVLATVLAVFVWKQPKGQQRKLGAEAVMVILAICSWRLGEVLLTVPWGLSVGLAMSMLAQPRDKHKYLTDYELGKTRS